MASDDEDFVFYGTPIEREEEVTTRKKKAIAGASGQLRTTLPTWKQEVTDEEGRRRFHGAFTGGFSAGYYNTVGSKEGWTPQTFTSSRKNRAAVKQQDIYNFLDEDEKAELEGRSLGTSMQFDTFGFTAAELARKQAEKEQKQRPSTVPGLVPDELIVPVTESIGVKLLLKMGWRQGRSIKDSNRSSIYDARRQARKAFLALSNDGGKKITHSKPDEEDTADVSDLLADEGNRFSESVPAYIINPKQDLHGLGYDPFKQAPEFREKKRQRMSAKGDMGTRNSLAVKGKIGPGFGIGALEDLDAEDDDVYDSGYDFQDTYVQEIEEPSQTNMDTLRILDRKKPDVLTGFKAASHSDRILERFDPPQIPKDFVPHHKFSAPLGSVDETAETPPAEVPVPEDNNLKVLIEGVASLVARSGKLFEDLYREKNQSNPLFDFLRGGNGSDFYARKLWEECQKRGEQQTKLWEGKKSQNSEQLTAERRGKILGEKALERSMRDSSSLVASASSVNILLKLSDTFTKPAPINEQQDFGKPFLDDPAKQKRFEQFLKEKYEGGLRSKDSGGSSNMSEAARARERLEFEAAAEAIEKGKTGEERNSTSQVLSDMSASAGLQFTLGGVEEDKVSQDEDLIMKAMYPKREEFQWRPAPILCKRFDLIDPYMGKPPPAPRVRSKMDSLLFMPDSIKTATVEEHVVNEQASSVAQTQKRKPGMETADKEIQDEVEIENVERPVDLYKAIFSDSDDEEETTTSEQVEDTQKKIEVANTTLNRLMAGDFLESLGKELGLMVPPEKKPLPENKTVRKENINVDGESSHFSMSEKMLAAPNFAGSLTNVEKTVYTAADDLSSPQVGSNTVAFPKTGMQKHDSKENLKISRDEKYVDYSHKTRKSNGWSSSSSDDERGRKKSRSHGRKSRNSGSDTSNESSDYRDRHRSKSRRKEKGSFREKSSSKRHSKHHKHRRKDSPSRSHRGSGKEHESRKKKKSKYDK
ncbi:G patch domain-containing protein TGH [Striga hermonthica]|uniref:G patch domain-containing protein TGH n=1 Tax=Striga hermonthica TaxID=68872 RepID=A0A9N7RKE7_STRHE|nr:G patch domain-containing protein TGH [Striga hermonthica]